MTDVLALTLNVGRLTVAGTGRLLLQNCSEVDRGRRRVYAGDGRDVGEDDVGLNRLGRSVPHPGLGLQRFVVQPLVPEDHIVE